MAIDILYIDSELPPGVLQTLESTPQVHLAELLTTASEALKRVEAGAGCDLVVVNIDLSDGCGTDVVRAFAQCDPPVKSLVVTDVEKPALVLKAIEAGTDGYILRSEAPQRLITAIEDVMASRNPISPAVLASLFSSIRKRALPEEEIKLTKREEETLLLLSRGLRYAECARVLGIKLGTVQQHVKRLYRKLDVNSKAEATAWAIRNGIVE